ncbi:MAG: hypothetical protein RR290_02800 [Clostridia bacterium]
MILSCAEAETIYKTRNKLRKALKEKEILRIERGYYSKDKFVNPIELIVKKYPNYIISKDTAFYIHGLTDVIPNKIDLSTPRVTAKINDEKINQMFVSEKFFEIGKTKMTFEGVEVNVYDKERMLIELMRNQKSVALDYYIEIINSYRQIKNELNITKITEYMKNFKNENFIYDKIMKAVM